MGCLTRAGCAVVLLVGGAIAWWWSGGTIPDGVVERAAALRDRIGGKAVEVVSNEPSEALRSARWQSVDDAGLGRAQDAISRLAAPDGPARIVLEPGDLAAFLATGMARQLPASARAAQVAIVGDRVYVKAEVALADVGGAAVLGPFADMLSARDTVILGASVDPLDADRMQLRIREVVMGDFGLPSRLIPRLVGTFRRGDSVPGLAPDALPLPLPSSVADVRIADGRITLYKAGS